VEEPMKRMPCRGGGLVASDVSKAEISGSHTLKLRGVSAPRELVPGSTNRAARNRPKTICFISIFFRSG